MPVALFMPAKSVTSSVSTAGSQDCTFSHTTIFYGALAGKASRPLLHFNFVLVHVHVLRDFSSCFQTWKQLFCPMPFAVAICSLRTLRLFPACGDVSLSAPCHRHRPAHTQHLTRDAALHQDEQTCPRKLCDHRWRLRGVEAAHGLDKDCDVTLVAGRDCFRHVVNGLRSSILPQQTPKMLPPYDKMLQVCTGTA